MEPFCTHPDVFAVQPVRNPDDADIFDQAVSHLKYQTPVNGGATRQASVRAGLEALASEAPDIVLIHDAARAFVTDKVISRAIDAALITGAAIPVVPVTDTIKVVDATGAIQATPDRANLRIAQTPQAFRFDTILEAHRRAAREGRDDFTDDAAIAEWAGLTVATFEGDAANMKLTTPEDFAREEARLGAMLGDIRTGTGYDVHALTDGDHLMLIAHLEVTMICEAPKIGPLRDEMRAKIAEITGLPQSRVAVKATTSERLGFTGRQEGIAATAAATIRLPTIRALSRSLLDLCRMRKLTIATAESCTGGLVAAALTEIPGSSDVVDRGFITYSNEAKHAMLGVETSTLETFGAVSKETATAMAFGALEHADVDLAVSITGIAGPGGATPGKPVGLVYLAVAARDGRIAHKECRFGACSKR
ncbi:competence-damaged protein-domain-containing protein [Syncephalis pseudoplumigaleata]|uniref:Competence-damaged protein-domain-containing protein n=1 Tax=Syncephalis pseudoplumigaleata TaxID=1712513 RepID=A0A4P9Z381_9FUNG|nr:competence-damaged protein-domain-containing protein [Syncephalis pseudoplumigaleata]|eukprot:RKP27003.1 competence-damaged protein-domain-containing protein [Syncephalis pseudoplumigaleata]